MRLPDNRDLFDVLSKRYVGAGDCGLFAPGALALATADEATRELLRAGGRTSFEMVRSVW